MPKLDSQLERGLSIFDRRRLFSDRAVWTFGLAGLAIVVGAFSGLWESSGYMVDELTGPRFVAASIAALYGLILGWMIFPRQM